MIKKNIPSSYTSSMQGQSKHDNQGTRDTTPTKTGQPLGAVKPILSKDRSKNNGGGGVANQNPRVDQLGTQNNFKHNPTRLALACHSISKMITLPKLTGYALLLFIAVVSFMLFYPYDPIKFNQLPIPVLNENNEVRAGEELILYMDYVKEYQCDLVEANYYLIDGFVIKMNVDSRVRPVGENKTPRIIPIPTSAPVGEDRHIQIDYSCKPNPLRTIYYTWTTEEFNILPGKEDL